MSANDDRLIIFDTTLRDGEQSPGCTMTRPEKLRVAHALAELGVDVIEAGFPIASDGDFESVREIAREVEGPVICGLARCLKADITRAADAVRDAARSRIHVFLATSPIHREFKLNAARDEIVRRAAEGVSLAREFCEDVEFSPEDASRTEWEFLAEVVERAIDAGATTINIPDTVGYAMPGEYGDLFRYLRSNVRGIEGVVLSAHCHDDLGLAVANSLAAVEAGARQVECTINGIGERAGNCSLEEIVMAIRTRADRVSVQTTVETRRLYPMSRMVTGVTGSPVQSNKAIVGENAFAHEAGIHQHGVLQHSATYEIMRPEDVGMQRSRLVLGKHSGRHALRERLKEIGHILDDEALDLVFTRFKSLADRKKRIYDEDLEALALGIETAIDGPWTIESLHTSAGTGTMPTAAVRLKHVGGRTVEEAAVGDGPIDAAFKAIERATNVEMGLLRYRVRSVSVGEDAQGEVTVDVMHDGRTRRGRGVATDIVEASAQAFLSVINGITSSNAGGGGGGARRESMVTSAQAARQTKTGAAG